MDGNARFLLQEIAKRKITFCNHDFCVQESNENVAKLGFRGPANKNIFLEKPAKKRVGIRTTKCNY